MFQREKKNNADKFIKDPCLLVERKPLSELMKTLFYNFLKTQNDKKSCFKLSSHIFKLVHPDKKVLRI